jgi:hypothetical protein
MRLFATSVLVVIGGTCLLAGGLVSNPDIQGAAMVAAVILLFISLVIGTAGDRVDRPN